MLVVEDDEGDRKCDSDSAGPAQSDTSTSDTVTTPETSEKKETTDDVR